MSKRASIAASLSLLLVLFPATAAFGYAPDLQAVMPRGGQRGTEFDLHLHGQRLSDAQEILFYSPGITVTSLHPDHAKPDNAITAHIVIAPDARIGEYALRLRTATGVSALRTFWIGPYPVVEDTGKLPNRDPAHAMKIAMNVTVAGTVLPEAVNFYRVDAKKGQRLSIEVLGMRLGDAVFDPCVAILDAKKTQIAFNDDNAFALADPVVSIIAPEDGTYYIVLSESTYGGGPDAHFLMHVGTFPRPTTTFPLGGQPGQPLALTFLGDVRGPISQTIQLPGGGATAFECFAEQDGLLSPTPNRICVDDCVNTFAGESNHSLATATVAQGKPPLALNGVISGQQQADYFRIKCDRGKPVNVRVIARALRSPIDSVLTIFNAAGRQLAQNDDSENLPDSYLHFIPPADGEYVVRIADQLGRGGPDFTYRIEVTADAPGLASGLFVPQAGARGDASLFESISVPRGNRCAAIVRIYRGGNYTGPARLSAPDLPAGVTMRADPVGTGRDAAAVIFTASAQAPVAGKLCGLHIESTDPKIKASGEFRQAIILSSVDNAALDSVTVDRMAVAVTNPSSLLVSVATPKVPLVQGGTMELKIHVDRQPGSKDSLSLRVLDSLPPGVEAPASVTVSPGHDDVVLPISAASNAPVGTINLCVVGESHISSDLFPVQIVEPMLQANLPALVLRPGKTTTVHCPLDQREKFDGSAKLQLMGLPLGCTADDVQVTDSAQQAIFTIVTDATAAPIKAPIAFVQVTIQKGGLPIVYDVDRGTMVRVSSPHGRSSSPVAAASVHAGSSKGAQ